MAQALTRVTKKYGNLVMCYVDDVVIATPTLEDHIDRLDEVFGCMERAGLKCKPSKCEILRDSIKNLGRMVERHGVRPDPKAVEAVLTWKAPRTDTQLLSFLGFANYYREFIKGYADKVYPMQKLMRNKGEKFELNDEAQVAFENIKRELCEAPVLGMPTEKGMYVLDTDASVVAILGILHQEQDWNGRTVLPPIAYGSKVLSDTEMKYGAPKAEMFAVVTFVEKYRACLGSAPFKLRVDNRALSWLKTYSMDQSYIGRWIVRLDGYHMIIEHKMRDKHQNADSLSKKTEFYERLEQKQANEAEIKEGFSFLDKETYEALPLTRWLDNSGHPIPGHPELPVEKAAEIKILSREDPVPLDLLLRSNLVQQELSRMNVNSLSLLDKTVQVTPQVMRMLGGLLEREVTRDDPEWTAALGVTGLLDTGAIVSVMPIKSWERMGFTREDIIPTNLRLAAANRGAIYVAGRTPITVLHMGGRDLWMSFLVVENLDDADQFILGRDFVRNFDVMIDLMNGLIRIRNADRKYDKRPINRIITDENKVPIFLDRKVKLQPGQAVVAIF